MTLTNTRFISLAVTCIVACVIGAPAFSQELKQPSEGAVVHATIPHFEWSSEVAYPWPGTYRIEIASDPKFTKIVDKDEIPAILEHYSPAKSLPYATEPLHWRVQYVNSDGVAGSWKSGSFLHQAPTKIVKVPLKADWKTIHAAFISAKDKAAATKDWVKLEFEKGTYAVTQIKGDSALFEAGRKDGGVLVEGNGATFLITATQDDCGVISLTNSSHAQFRNFTVDYTADSLGMLAGTITEINSKAGTFSVQMLPGFEPSLREMGSADVVFFIDGKNHQRFVGSYCGYKTSASWAKSQDKSHTGLFHFTIPGKKDLLAVQGKKRTKKNTDSVLPKVGDIVVTGGRRGDALRAQNGSKDLLFENITTRACRSRLVIPKRGCNGFRVINCNFTRARTGVLAAPSGGVNSSSAQVWIEGCKFEGTRDDSVNFNNEQSVFRNCQVSWAYRHSLWIHGARQWIEGNRVDFSSSGIALGGTGIDAHSNSVVHAFVVENNTVSRCNGSGLVFGGIKASLGSNPLANMPDVPKDRHSDIRISGNKFIGNKCQPAISISNAVNVWFVGNQLMDDGCPIPKDASENPPIAIRCENVTGYHEEGNIIKDKRIKNTQESK